MKPNFVLIVFILSLAALSFSLFDLYKNYDIKSQDSSSYIQAVVWLCLSIFWFYNWRKAKAKKPN